MANERPRKRVWGKTKNRGKGPPELETVECDMELVGNPIKRIKLSNDEKGSSQHSVDLQHPELMSDSVLVEALSDIKVPIPIYSDGTPSRERLIHLFKKHVTPRPQRTRDEGRFWRKQSGLSRAVPMDTSSSNDQDQSGGGGRNDLTAIQRKRAIQDNDSSPLKKPSLQIPFKSLSVNDHHSTSPDTVQKDSSLTSIITCTKIPSRIDNSITDTLLHSTNTSSKGKITWP